MTFHIIPWMWGIDGDKTCGISDTIYVTENGCTSFFDDFPQDMVIKANGHAEPQPQSFVSAKGNAKNKAKKPKKGVNKTSPEPEIKTDQAS